MIDPGTVFPVEPTTGVETPRAVCVKTAGEVYQQVIDLIQGDLSEVETQIRVATSSRYDAVNQLSTRAAAMGGKRLRPILVLLAAAATRRGQKTERQQSDLCSIATAIELVHAASLVHDDVMDEADRRRHQPTVGSVTGNHNAVLLGDFLFTRAYAMAASCRGGYPARQLARASTALCEGELRQQASEGNWDISLREYRSFLEQKTGALCEVSCRLGAWAVGSNREHRSALARFGKLTGLAFQLVDDWLDYWGTDRVGKTLGTDLVQRKPTLPIIRLLRTVSATRRVWLLELLRADAGNLGEEIRRELDQSDACEYTLSIARRCIRQAINALDILPDSHSKQCLHHIAEFSIAREG